MAKGLGKGIGALFPGESLEQSGQVEEIQLDLIVANPFQPRKIFDEEALQELADSINEHGILQPIAVRKKGRKFEIVAGERRYRACLLAGLDVIPVIIKELSDAQMMELAILENLQREDLTVIEEAEAYQSLMENLHLTQEELSKRLGKSRPHIANHVRLLALPEDVRKFMNDGTLSMGQGRALLGLKNKRRISEVAMKVMKQGLNVRQVEMLVQSLNEEVSRETIPPKKKDIFVAAKESQLRDYFGTNVQIRKNNNKGKIEIEFYSEDDLERILEILNVQANRRSLFFREKEGKRVVILGALINAVLIIAGALVGRIFKNIPESMKSTVLSIIGLAVALLGIKMGFESDNFIILIVSLVVGTVVGEWLDLDKQMNRLGKWVESLFRTKRNDQNQISIAEGFVTASLIFVVGSMAVIGALDSGLRNDHNVLITKGLIDGFTSIILASTLGIGVLLSAIPVFIYQGLIAVFAGVISSFIPDAALQMYITEMTAVGGVMIMAIGLNIAGLTKIKAANLLPGIVIVGIMVAFFYIFQ